MSSVAKAKRPMSAGRAKKVAKNSLCLLYTSDAADD